MVYLLGKFKKPAPDYKRYTRDELISLYKSGVGFVGKEPEVEEQLRSELRFTSIEDAAHQWGYAESGKGKLFLQTSIVERYNPQHYPGPAQTTGSCVSRSTVNAGMNAICCEIAAGLPDPVSGEIEGPPPDVPNPAQQSFDHAIIYGCRGHRGQGSSCSRLAKAVSDYGGFLPRGVHDVPGYGKYDCSRYDDRQAHNFGPKTPEPLLKYARQFAFIREVTFCETLEGARDALFNGHGISACSGIGFEGNRNEHGVTFARGSWSHAMAWGGFDDRPWAHKTYGGMLVLILNSWAKYNSGSRKVHGTNLYIPHGSFWSRAKDAMRILRARGTYVFSSADGFPARNLTHLGATGLI